MFGKKLKFLKKTVMFRKELTVTSLLWDIKVPPERPRTFFTEMLQHD